MSLDIKATHAAFESAHIAGDPTSLSAAQSELIALAAELGRSRFAARASRVDREAAFPFDNFDDLREAGLLGLCVPKAHGGFGAGFATAALVGAEIGRHCGSTALAFNMHVSAGLWAGVVADAMPLSPLQREDHTRHAARHFECMAREGQVFAQAFSEGGAASAGNAPWATRARKADSGYVIDGRKVFTSLAGVADVYCVLCTLDGPDQPAGGGTQRDAIVLAVPADSTGVSVSGQWDSLGMRGTVSRTIEFAQVSVPASARLLPEGVYFPASQRFPHMFGTLASPYMGIAQAAYDFTVHYLRAELPGMPPVKRRMYPTKQIAVSEMRIKLEQTRALFLQNAREAGLDPDHDARMRLYAAHHTVMENAQAICALAIRTCGGQSMVKSLPLERLYRDARCGSLMLPWTAELCLDHLGRECLYEQGEGGEAIDW